MEETTLARLFVKRVNQHAARIRFMEKTGGRWRPVTFRCLGEEVREIALGLQALGLSKSDRVCLMAGVRREWFACDWAIICTGALTVPIYPNDAPSQAAYIMDHSQARWAIVENMDMLRRIQLTAGIPAGIKEIIVLEGTNLEEDTPQTLFLDRLKAMGRQYGHMHSDAFAKTVDAVNPSDPLTIMYTSGTTGVPKGVVSTHASYLFMIHALDKLFPLGPDDCNLQFLPPAHAYGRLEHFITHHKGITTWIAESMETVADNLREARPTFLLAVPRFFEKAYFRIMNEGHRGTLVHKWLFSRAFKTGKRVSRCLQEGRHIPIPLRIQYAMARLLVFRKIMKHLGGRLRFAICGAAPLSRVMLDFFHACGLLILEGWGMTEIATVGTVNRLDRYRFGTIGLPVPGVEIRVAPDGEILLRGPSLFVHYHRDPESTAEAMDPEGWLHTGDVGHVDADGFVYITDRKKDLIITAGGKNIAPQKLENLLVDNPIIDHAVVYGDGKKCLTALFTLNEAAARQTARDNGIPCATLEEMATHPVIVGRLREWVARVNEQLAPYETIKDFRIAPQKFSIEGEELTPTLKIKRKNVIEKYQALLNEMYSDPEQFPGFDTKE